MVHLRALSAGLLICILFLSGCSPQLKVVAIRVPEIGMCVDYDPVAHKPIDPVTTYPAGTRKVMVYFRTEPDVAGDIAYRWYKEGTFLGQQVAPAETGYNFGWMTGSAALPTGSYEVVVAMVGGVELRRTSFVISP